MKTVRCFSWLGFIVALAAATTVFAQIAPSFYGQPYNKTVFAGQVMQFSAAANGSPTPDYQWQRLPVGDSTWINLSDTGTYSGAATDSLSIGIAIIAMSGDQFRCIATNTAGSVASSAATLTVSPAVAPSIYGLPAGITVNYGASLSMSPSISGTAPFTYQWKKDSVDLASATSSFYSKSGVTTADAGQYTLTATNYAGIATSAVVVVTINPAVAPTIYNVPAGITVNTGQAISLSPSINGTLPITYQWKQDGVVLVNGTSANYSKSSATTADSGQYTLTATNSVGTVTSTPVSVTVNPAVAPIISNLPLSLTTIYGGSISFTPTVAGTQPMTYQWKRDGVALSGATGSWYSHSSATSADSGLYTLTATNSVGTVTSASVAVTVYAAIAPVINGQSSNVTVNYGTSLSLSASISGTLPMAYQWKKDGVNVASGPSSSYFKSDVTTADAGQYTLTVTNAAGTVTSAVITVTVNTPVAPVISNLPSSLNVSYGESFSFSPAISGTQPMTYQWKKDGVNVANGTSSYYSKSNVTTVDAGQYTLSVTNSVGTVTSAPIAVTINPAVAPVVTNMPPSRTVNYGGYLSIIPSISGTQPMTLQWKKDGVAVPNATSSSYSKDGVTTADSGEYTLTATNSVGMVTSEAVTVTITQAVAPVITNVPPSIIVNYGDYLSINPSVSGTQPMTYQWKKEGVAVPNGASSSYSKSGATTADSGQYTLTVTNSAGTVTSTAALVTINSAIAPQITGMPAVTVINSGENLNIAPTITGTGPMTYVWEKDGAIVPGAVSASYTKGSATTVDSGQYTVTVTNLAGTVTSSATLVTVNSAVAPLILNLPTALTLAYGSSLNLSPIVSGTQPMTYQWKKDGLALASGAAISYSKNYVTTDDSGQYTLSITNSVGTVTSATVFVTVNSALSPAIYGLPTTVTIDYGNSLSLYATVAGTQPMTYQWKKDGVDLTSSTSTSYNKSGMTPDGSGQYTLVATNFVGTVTSAAVAVTVNAAVAPTITQQPASLTIVTGSTASFSVSVAGTNRFAYQWLLDGQPVVGAIYSTLTIPNAQARDAGSYTVKITNPGGSVTSNEATLTISPAVGVIAVYAGMNHSLLIKSDGSLWAMGRNDFGQLGDGTNASHNTPRQIAASVVAASAGGDHSLFIKSDGTLWASGNNSSGQLGDGTSVNHSTPVQIATGTVAASAGGDHSLFIKSDGTLWAMGNNFYSQLGDGTTNYRGTPVKIAAGVMAATAGNGHSLFIKSDGTLWAMGNNSSGQLGDGTTTRRSTPVQIATGVVSVEAGGGIVYSPNRTAHCGPWAITIITVNLATGHISIA